MTRSEREKIAFQEREAKRCGAAESVARDSRAKRRNDALYRHARLVDEHDRDFAGEFSAE